MTDIELTLADGMVLRGQHWTHCQEPWQGDGQDRHRCRHKAPTTKILALHGWLDNCRSFHHLAPNLLEKWKQNYPNDSPCTSKPKTELEQPEQELELVAIDLPGHGLSSHRPLDGPTTVLSEGAFYIAEIIDALGWGADATATSNENTQQENSDLGKVALIGHSMGGGMAITYAGVFPEKVSRVVSIDIYGPEPGNPRDAVSQIRSHVSQRQRMGPLGRPRVLYPSLERAIERRQKAATLAPGGNQYLSPEAAKELVVRSMEAVYDGEGNVDDDDDDDADGITGTSSSIRGYQFRHDARLMWPSLQYLTVEQIQSILEGVECPVCIIAAEDGYPFAKDRIDRVIAALEPQTYQILPGSHHLHADPDTADAVVDVVCDFFGSRG